MSPRDRLCVMRANRRPSWWWQKGWAFGGRLMFRTGHRWYRANRRLVVKVTQA